MLFQVYINPKTIPSQLIWKICIWQVLVYFKIIIFSTIWETNGPIKLILIDLQEFSLSGNRIHFHPGIQSDFNYNNIILTIV